MKRKLLVVMMMALIISMVGCGKKGNEEDISSENNTTKEESLVEIDIADEEMKYEKIILPEEPFFELDEISSDKMISKSEIPSLIRGIENYEELEFCIRVIETKRLTQLERNIPCIQNGLEIIWHEPRLENVYTPLKDTKYSYDVNELNRIFNAITSDRIYENNIPDTAILDSNRITFTPCNEEPETRVGIHILRIYYDESNNICMDFNFKQLYNSEGTSYCEGTTFAYFTPDDNTGEYKFDHLMEHNSRKVNLEEKDK